MNAPLASLEGQIVVRLSSNGAGKCAVSIQSTRPFDLPKAFVGHAAEQVVTMVGLVFGLCGRAQQAASLGALEAALGSEPSADTISWRAAAIRAEAKREILLRRAGQAEDADLDTLQTVAKAAQSVIDAAKPAFELGAQLQEPLSGEVVDPDHIPPLDVPSSAQSKDDLWTADHTVPALTPDDLHLLVSGFSQDAQSGLIAKPEIGGKPRWTKGGVPDPSAPLYRMQARGNGWGAATVMTARGLLTHWAQLNGNRVAAYQIIAPTEWNFHPHGIASQLLKRLPFDAATAAKADRIAQAIDPCVALSIEIGEETANA